MRNLLTRLVSRAFEVFIKLLPYNDSACLVLQEFPSVSLIASKIGNVNRYEKFIVLGVGDPSDLLKLISDYEKRAHVGEVEIVYKSRNVISFIIAVKSRRRRSYNVFEATCKHNCMIINPLFMKNGEKRFRIIVPSRKSLELLLSDLSRGGKLQVINIRKAKFSDQIGVTVPEFYDVRLSPMQYKALMTALRMGYYKWRRDVKLLDIAKELGITTATLSEHLRKAENKLISSMMTGLSKYVCLPGTSISLPRELVEDAS